MCFYLFLHQGTIDFLIPPPLWEDPVSRCLCLGEVWGISNKKGFEIPWFLGQLRFFLTFYCGDSPYGKVRRDARHMTHITYRFYGFVSKRHGLLVHFGWKLGLPKKNWRHAMRFCFQHSLLISQLILEKKTRQNSTFPLDPENDGPGKTFQRNQKFNFNNASNPSYFSQVCEV